MYPVSCPPAVPRLSPGCRLLCCGQLGYYQDNSMSILEHLDMVAAAEDQKAMKALRKFVIYRVFLVFIFVLNLLRPSLPISLPSFQ